MASESFECYNQANHNIYCRNLLYIHPTVDWDVQIIFRCYSINIMACNSLALFAVVLGGFLVVHVYSHGYIYDPPGRSSVWRIFKDQAPENFNDNGIYCGGFNVCIKQKNYLQIKM